MISRPQGFPFSIFAGFKWTAHHDDVVPRANGVMTASAGKRFALTSAGFEGFDELQQNPVTLDLVGQLAIVGGYCTHTTGTPKVPTSAKLGSSRGLQISRAWLEAAKSLRVFNRNPSL